MKTYHEVRAESFNQNTTSSDANTMVGTLTVTGAITATGGVSGAVTGNVTGNLIGDLAPAAETAEHGPGVIGTGTQTAPITTRWIEAGVIITQIKFDITGLACVGTSANDVIGLAAGGAAYLGRNVISTNGVIFKAELACLETPGQGTATITGDIDIATNASAALIYDGAAGTNKLINGATLVVGQTLVNTQPAVVADEYYYIVEADTAGTTGVYNAGQYVLTTYGYPLLT